MPASHSAAVRVPAGTAAEDALRDAGVDLSGPRAAVVVRDPAGDLRDLTWTPDSDVDVEPVRADSADGLAIATSHAS